jgi:hypothetical protein
MAGIVAALKVLSLDEQIRAYPEISAVFEAAKNVRRFKAEIRALGCKLGEGKRPPSAAVKYRSLHDPDQDPSGPRC